MLAATAATTNAATFNGQGATLTLDHVGNLSGAIGGVGLDDTFDLVGVTANGASVNGSNQLVVTDNGTTVDTLQLSGNNSGFYFLPVAVSGGTDIVSRQCRTLPIPATVADYLDVQSLYDQIPGGFAISDTAANICASLDQLNDLHIASIAASGGPLVVIVSTFSADQSTLDKIVGGFDVSDTAANISADLNALDDGNINSITISDNGDVGASAAQLTSDSTAISKLVNANGTPYQLAIAETAANIEAGVATLEADFAHIASITATGGPVAVSVSTFSSDQSALETIVGGFDVSDTAANISSDLNALDDAHINSITISDNGDVGASAAQLTGDSTAISKLVNANGTAFQLAIAETAANIEAGVATLEADGAHIASITATGGPVVVSVSTFSSDQSALDTIVGGFDVSDTAANISASLNALDDANINSITISDNGDAGASVAQLTSDATAIGKLVSANATPYQLAITDTATNVLSGLATLEADVAHIASIAASGGPLVVSVSSFLADQAALDKISGGFDVSDAAANISANLNLLNDDRQINSITISNNGAIGVPIATNGVTILVQVDGHYELEAVSSGTGPLIELNGSAVTATQFPAGWTPVGAKQTGDGYEVAWSVPGKNEYEVWNTDGNGDYTSAATGILSGTSATLEAVEANFGDGTFPGAGPPASTTTIATNGATTLDCRLGTCSS